jgi:hypothetical protein
VAEPKLLQDLSHGALVIDDAEALSHETLQVDPAPAHDAMHGPIRTGLDKTGQLRLLLGGQTRRVALRPSVLQPIRSTFVEAVNPITQRLPVHAADPRRLYPVHPLQHRSQ